MMQKIYYLLIVSILLNCYGKIFAQPDLQLTQITTVNQPVDITGCGDNSGRLFIVDKSGKIRIYDQNTNTLLSGNFLNISTQVSNSGERGLLGLAFHPDFATNGYFYVNYVHSSDNNTRISRFTASPPSSNTVLASSELELMEITQPFSNHNGGDLAFGPDGYLYIGLGDGGSGGDPGNRSQNPAEILGKMLRIDVDNPSGGLNYGIPPSNPYIGVQTPVDFLDEIWAMGLRNPWRFSFDRSTGDLWIADVGQGSWEELNFQPSTSTGGENYGWRCYEGNHNFNIAGCAALSAYDGPIFEYSHNPTTGGNSITGGFVYRGTDFPSLQGWYIMADYTSDNFWLIQPNGSGGWTSDLQPDIPVADIVTFGEDDDGEMYVASYGGQVYKIGVAPLPVELLSFKGVFKDDKVKLTWETATERNTDYFEVERKNGTADFQSIAKIKAAGNSQQRLTYQLDDASAWPGENVYRLKMVDGDQHYRYTEWVSVVLKEAEQWQLSPNPADNKVTLSIQDFPGLTEFSFEMMDAQGKKVLSYRADEVELPYQHAFDIRQLPKGYYSCRLVANGMMGMRQLIVR